MLEHIEFVIRKKSRENPYLGDTSGLTYKSNFKFKSKSSFLFLAP